MLILTFFIGLSVGIINTLAGGGSIITIPFLMMSGLNASVANASNRLGIFFQTVISSITFYKKGHIKKIHLTLYVIPSLIGALGGAYLASKVPKETMKGAIKVIITFLFFVIVFFNIKKYIIKREKLFEPSKLVGLIALIILGFYGGFIQAGFGLIFVAALHFFGGKNINETNAIKNLIVACYTLPVLVIFIYYDLIAWKEAILLTFGQATGGWLGAKIATTYVGAQKWVRILFYVMLIVSLAKLYGLF